MVVRAIKRLFGRSHEGPAAVSPEQAEIRLKSLKAKVTRNKSEAKRLASEMNLGKGPSPDRKTEIKARLKELETERKETLREMKTLHKRLPKK